MLRRTSLIAVALVAAWLVACAFLFVWPRSETGAPMHADAIVMLSGATQRLPKAEELARRGTAPVLAISTDHGNRGWPAAVAICRAHRYAGAHVLCFQAHPYSTRGEAETVTRLARSHGWHSLVVVTSTYHLTRAELLFRRCWKGPLALVGAGDAWWRLPDDWANETAKLAVQYLVHRSC